MPDLTLSTPILSLPQHGIPRLGAAGARRLALALANVSGKRDAGESTVEDLLNYLPMRYEDRSNLARISDLYDGMEASLELYVRVAGGFQVGKNRSPKAPPLMIFEITASAPERTGKPVVVWWFVSGRQASRIVAYNRQSVRARRAPHRVRPVGVGRAAQHFALRPQQARRVGNASRRRWTLPEHALLRLSEEGEKGKGEGGKGRLGEGGKGKGERKS